MRENDDSIIEVSLCEALVISDASEIGAIKSHPNPVPQQDTLAADQIPVPQQDTLAADQIPILSQKLKSRETIYSLVQVRRSTFKIWITGQSSQKI